MQALPSLAPQAAADGNPTGRPLPKTLGVSTAGLRMCPRAWFPPVPLSPAVTGKTPGAESFPCCGFRSILCAHVCGHAHACFCVMCVGMCSDMFNSLLPDGLYPPGSSVHGLPRQECWSELPFPPPGDLPDPGIDPASPTLAGRSFTSEPPGKPCVGTLTLRVMVLGGGALSR